MSAKLERRYQRLLRCYPPGHRADHGEEMLGILLDSARPGQRAPGLSQMVNLAACGLAIRARHFLTAGPWQDALAVLSLIAPVVLVITSALSLAQLVRSAVNEAAFAHVPVWQLLSFVATLAGPAAVLAAWLTVVLLALTGRRRTAATIATVLLALDLTTQLTLVIQRAGVPSARIPMALLLTGAGPILLASLAACSLAFSAGPSRGLAIVGWPRACLMIAGLCVTFGFFSVLLLVAPSAHFPALVFTLLTLLTTTIGIAATRNSGTAGSRIAVLITVGLLPGLIDAFSSTLNPTADLVIAISYILLALLTWPLAIASRKRQPTRT